MIVLEQKKFGIYTTTELSRWTLVAVRWVDGFWCAAIGVFQPSSDQRTSAKIKGVAKFMAKQLVDKMCGVYHGTGLGFRVGNEAIFAGMAIRWSGSRLMMVQDFLSDMSVRKFVNAYAFGPLSRKIGLVAGMIIGVCDRASDLDFEETLTLLSRHLHYAGYFRSIIEPALLQLQSKNPYLRQKFDHAIRPLFPA